jgi:WD40 repeat protein
VGIEDGPAAMPPPAVKPLEPPLRLPSTQLTIDARFNEVKDLAFSQDQGVACLYWDTRGKLQNFCDYWDWKMQKRLAHIEFTNFGNGIEINPRGTRLLCIQNAPAGLTAWSLPDGKQLFKDWNPYARDPKLPFDFKAPQLVWASYIDDNRLVSISRTGQFDVWDMNQKQVVASHPAQAKMLQLAQNFFARAPHNFAISPDRRYLALANGDGFDLFDTATAKRIGATQSFGAEGKMGNVWSVSFNRDGTQLASKYNLNAPNQEYVSAWVVPAGVRKSHHPVQPDFSRNGPMTWLGPNHLMIWDGNVFKGSVFRLSDGKFLRTCDQMNAGDRFARSSPDGRIWYCACANAAAQAQIVAVDFPEKEAAGPNPGANPPPVWYFGIHGIVRNR